MPIKVLNIVGARPNFIKATMLVHSLKKSNHFRSVMIHTGQHYDYNMSKIFFDELDLPAAKYYLGINRTSHARQIGEMLIEIEKILIQEKPNWVLVYGDTNSTLAGALAAAKLNLPIAHIEAGLRSFDQSMPEEINRVLTDQVSSLLFTPTKQAVSNLQREGIASEKIKNVGDLMYDSIAFYNSKVDKKRGILLKYRLESKNYILATIHRQENTDNFNRLKCIFEALNEISQKKPVILPLHPRTEKMLKHYNLLDWMLHKNILFIEPVGYLDMLALEKNALLIVTDSGGVQKEAFFYQIPCVTVREQTEWVESVDLGWNTLVPPIHKEEMCVAIFGVLGKSGQRCVSPYGNGCVAEKIVKSLEI